VREKNEPLLEKSISKLIILTKKDSYFFFLFFFTPSIKLTLIFMLKTSMPLPEHARVVVLYASYLLCQGYLTKKQITRWYSGVRRWKFDLNVFLNATFLHTYHTRVNELLSENRSTGLIAAEEIEMKLQHYYDSGMDPLYASHDMVEACSSLFNSRIFTLLHTNKWTPAARRAQRKLSGDIDNQCGCAMGALDKCSNETLAVFCDSPLHGQACRYPPFELRKRVRGFVAMTKESGWAYFTDEDLTAGQYVDEYLGEVIVQAEYDSRLRLFKSKEAYDLYFAELGDGLYLDARNAGNDTRYINSSVRSPNLELHKIHDRRVKSSRLGFFASKNIARGEELTFSYDYSFTLL
jgi:hypothetical protein